MTSRKRILLFFGILILAAVARLTFLHSLPPGLYPDEAVDGLDALHALDRADFKVFYPDNNGEEGLYMNIQAVAIQIFGVSAWTLRMVSAMAGILTVLAIYLLARELGLLIFKQEQRKKIDAFALLSAFLLAVSFWHINFSRIGFRAILLPLISTAAIYYLLKALRTKSSANFIFSGILFGLALYTYIASRVVPILAIAVFIYDFKTRRRESGFWKSWIIFAAAFILAATPLLGYFITHPSDFLGRAAQVSVFNAKNPVTAFSTSVAKTTGMFNIAGDKNPRHNVPGSPLLDLITGIFFLIGLTITIFWLVKRKGSKKLAPLLLILWFALLLLPEVTTAEGVPHALRALGAITPVIIFSALGALWFFDKTPKSFTAFIIPSALALIVLLNFYHYFYTWAKNQDLLNGTFRADLTLETELLKKHNDFKRYVIVNEGGVLLDGIPVQSATIRFLTEDNPSIHYLTENRISEIVPEKDKTIIVVTSKPSSELDRNLRAKFPDIDRKQQTVITWYNL